MGGVAYQVRRNSRIAKPQAIIGGRLRFRASLLSAQRVGYSRRIMFEQGTPFDLQMHVLRIPVRVIPTFWLVSALMGWDPERLDLVMLWVVCVFFSILVHELGHALTAEAFGYNPHIVLYHFGGYAAYHPGYDHSFFRSLLISLAGPFAGFGLAALTLGIMFALGHSEAMNNEYVRDAFSNLLWINIFWGVFNLLPVLPLDGGHVTESVLGLCGVRQPTDWALKVTIVVGGLGAALALHFGERYIGIMLALMAVNALQTLQSPRW